MTFCVPYRPRAIALVLALAFALVGLGFAPAAMAMQTDGAMMVGMSPSPMCLGCAGIDQSKAMPSGCAGAICAGVIAVLPATDVIQAAFPLVFPRIADSEGRGITVPPPLGPPRPLQL